MHGMIDMHCHLLPKVDDGAGSMKETLHMLRMEADDGVSDVILTPHFRIGMFETEEEKIEETYQRLQGLLDNVEIPVAIHLGCEYHASSHMVPDLKNRRRPTLDGSAFVLTEFSGTDRYSVITHQIDDLLTAGFLPIIAHAERIDCLAAISGRFEELVRQGAQIQITASTLLGRNGWGAGRLCRKMVRSGVVRYVASDAHNTGDRAPDLQECGEYLLRKFGAETAKELLVTNPQKILRKKEKQHV